MIEVEEAKTNESVTPAPTVLEAKPVTQPEKKGSGCWKWGLGCLGVGAVLVVVLLIVLALVGKSIVNSPEFQKAFKEGYKQAQDRQRMQQYGTTTPEEPTNLEQ